VVLLHQAGARPRSNSGVFFGACAGHPDFPAYVENLVRILIGARDAIVAVGEVDGAGLDACVESCREWGRRPDSAFWYMMSWAEGVRPGGPGDA